jgi:modulator of FtsH protease
MAYKKYPPEEGEHEMYTPYSYGQTSAAVRSSLVGKVFGLLAFSFGFTVIGGVVGMAVPGLALFATFGALACVFALNFVREKAGWNLGVLYAFTFLMGMGLGPIIGYYAAAAPSVVGNALLMTGGLTGGLGIYAWRTNRDLTKLQNFLFPALIGLVVLSLVGLFLHMTALQILLSLGTVVIFSGFMLVDIQRLRRAPDDSLPTAIIMTVGLYLNIINIFMAILQLLGIARNND